LTDKNVNEYAELQPGKRSKYQLRTVGSKFWYELQTILLLYARILTLQLPANSHIGLRLC